MRKYLVVATKDELNLPWARSFSELETIVTGVGGTNVIRALKGLPQDSQIYNVGYCGSQMYPVGTVLWVNHCRLWHPNVTFQERTFELAESSSGITCYTAGDFILNGEELPPDSVVDMELAYIAAFNFARVASVKYVSDNLNLKQYEITINHGTRK